MITSKPLNSGSTLFLNRYGGKAKRRLFLPFTLTAVSVILKSAFGEKRAGDEERVQSLRFGRKKGQDSWICSLFV